MNLLSVNDIVETNRRVIIETGGMAECAGCVANADSLYYIVGAGDASLYGESLYPTVFHKAAIYAYFISRDHVFVDGNKRTSMACALWFLRLNGVTLRSDLLSADIVREALDIACGRTRFDDVVRWLQGIAETLGE